MCLATDVVTADGASNQRFLRGRRSRILWVGLVMILLGVTGAIAQGQQSEWPRRSILLPETNRLPDANDQMEMRIEQQQRRRNFELLNRERKLQMTEDSAKMLKLAQDLKTEVEGSAEILPPDFLVKLEAIERLARNVQKKMKFSLDDGPAPRMGPF